MDRRRVPESGIRSVWELLQYYPRDYQNFEAGDWRPDAHVMAAGVVHASKVGRHVHSRDMSRTARNKVLGWPSCSSLSHASARQGEVLWWIPGHACLACSPAHDDMMPAATAVPAGALCNPLHCITAESSCSTAEEKKKRTAGGGCVLHESTWLAGEEKCFSGSFARQCSTSQIRGVTSGAGVQLLLQR